MTIYNHIINHHTTTLPTLVHALRTAAMAGNVLEAAKAAAVLAYMEGFLAVVDGWVEDQDDEEVKATWKALRSASSSNQQKLS